MITTRQPAFEVVQEPPWSISRDEPSRREAPRPKKHIDWMERFGGPVSTALLDPSCSRFEVPGIDGAIAYRRAWGAAVAIGDPICAVENQVTLAREFALRAKENRLVTVFAATGEQFAVRMAEVGFAGVAFGTELLLDPQRDPAQGSKGRELRKKLTHAQRAGLKPGEYLRHSFPNEFVERELTLVADAWLEHRHGPQVYLAHLDLFEAPSVTRYFYVKHGDRYVGVLTAAHLARYDGYLLNHIVVSPDAADGASELLITHALRVLRDEGCRVATFGPAPAPDLGTVYNLSARSERLARHVFHRCGEAFHLDARTRYRRKFQVASEEPSFLLFNPPRIGPRQMIGLLRAFNVSIA